MKAIRGQGGDAILAKTPLGRFGRPDDIAYCVLYLASDESSFATGAEFVTDGAAQRTDTGMISRAHSQLTTLVRGSKLSGSSP